MQSLSLHTPPTEDSPNNLDCRPFQEVDMEALAEADLPHLEHLELRVQNTTGFGARQLEPLSTAKLPNLR